MKKVVILGSAGSIGTQTLDIISRLPEMFEVYGLATLDEVEILAMQAKIFRPNVVAIVDEAAALEFKNSFEGDLPEILTGAEGVEELAARTDADIIVNAIVGSAGLRPSLAAIREGVRLCTANKESLVIAGHIIMPLVREHGAELIPIDSEHSALLQASLAGNSREIRRLILTASGGPFRSKDIDLDTISVADALQHPKWSMGPKITIDSATMMNKGLEVIEARWLFDIPPDRIDVLVHPQSIIHSIVEFVDGSQIAQASMPDMRLPIQYALTYPERRPSPIGTLNLAEIGELTFEEPDFLKFPALLLAFDALEAGGSSPCVLNAANEAAVKLFIEGKIRFSDIARTVNRAMAAHEIIAKPSIDEVLALDEEIRERTLRDHAR
ncbi:MAG TPA: 1-deoxy-D-xylulose-5-phosphate reductoisomerase [candidate division Zixibacteria bacterium]|nr:1-deoxy-D-xylulose-5-phosphate reductoisomerase [candidate division Zixibacteria bacterium]